MTKTKEAKETKVEKIESALKRTKSNKPNEKDRIETKDDGRLNLHWAIEDVAAKGKVNKSVAYAALRVHKDTEVIEGNTMYNIQPALDAIKTPEGKKKVVEEVKKLQGKK